jgi:hypothetical protein
VKNLPNKTDITNETKKDTKSERNFDLNNRKNAIISMVGTAIFAVLTILFPLFRILGGFLTYSLRSELLGNIERYFYWDQIIWLDLRVSTVYYNYNQFGNLHNELIWQIIHLWGPIWIILGLIGAGLVVLPSFQKLRGQKPVEVAKFGLIIGLFATVVEFGLFILALIFSNIHVIPYLNINFLLLGCFVIGWIGLIVGYVFTTKE